MKAVRVVKVLKVPRSAYDPSRSVSTLLRSQIAQLQAAVLEAVDSEAEASHCIQVLTALLGELRPQIQPRSHGERRRGTRRLPRSTRGRLTTAARDGSMAARTARGRKRR